MAELLTNDPNAMVSLSGYKPERPCGIFWFSPCTFNNFNDWLVTLRSRFNILKRNYTKLEQISKIPNKDILDAEELAVAGDMADIEEVIKEMKNTPPDLHRNTYYQKIASMQSALADTNALIEFVQERLEDRGAKSYITTGIQRPSTPWGTIFISALVIGGGAYLGYKVLKKPKSTGISLSGSPYLSKPPSSGKATP